MANLTGKILDVTNQPPGSVVDIHVKAPRARVGSGTGAVVSSPAVVDYNASTGEVTITNLTGGLSWLIIEGVGWSDTVALAVAEGMTTLVEAIANAVGVPGMVDYLAFLSNSENRVQQLASAAVAAELDYFEERLVPAVPQNLVDPDTAVYGLLAPDGLVISHATNQVTGWIPVTPGRSYVSWSSEVWSGSGHRLVFFDESHTVIPGGDTAYKPGRTTHRWTAPPTAAYARIGVSPMPVTPTPIDQVLIFHRGTALWDPNDPDSRAWWEDKITPPRPPVSVEDLDFSVGGKIPYGMVVMTQGDLQALRDTITSEAEAAIMDAMNSHYGGTPLSYPAGFAEVPLDLRKQPDGRVTHRFNFHTYQNAETHIWYDSTSTTDGTGAKTDPHRFWSQVLRTAEATPGDVVIHVVRPMNSRAFTAPGTGLVVDGKRVSIIPEGDFAWMTAATEPLSWTQDGAVWSAPRSAVFSVFLTEEDEHGIPTPLHSVTSLEDCRVTPASWWTDNTNVYINSPVAPTVGTHHVCIAVDSFGQVTVKNGGTLYMENIGILQGTVVNFRGEDTGTAIFNGCRFVGGNMRNQSTGIFGNGLNTMDMSRTLAFDCIAAHVPRDGFNYHYANTPVEQRRECLAFEYGCLAYGLGTYNGEGNNNATSSHEGNSVLRIGTVGRDMAGPALADVGGCLSVNYGCDMSDGAPNYLFEGGEAWLTDCISRTPASGHVAVTAGAVLHGDPIIVE